MAGFFRKAGTSFRKNSISQFLKELTKFGLDYDNQILKNSMAVGATQNGFFTGGKFMGDVNNFTEDEYTLFLGMSIGDLTEKKRLSFYEKDYKTKLLEFQRISLEDEIEDILDTVADETIVYDDSGYFCKPRDIQIDLKDKEKINNQLNANFKKIYNLFGFKDTNTAWSYFKKWLIEGFLAFEIVYDDNNENITGFNLLDSTTLEIGFKDNKRVWYQNRGAGANREKELYDSQIIYISYSFMNSPSRISYLEGLIRPFNIMRTMEQTRIVWSIVNSSFKQKFLVPVGSQSKNRGKQTLRQFMNQYKEDIQFDSSTGKVEIKGQPNLPFYKQYWFPISSSGTVPEIDNVNSDGPQLNDSELLRYFYNKLKLVSKIPFSRFEREAGSGNFGLDASGIQRDEIKFSRFITRIRNLFKEIIEKPLWIQMVLDFPELKEDNEFKSDIEIEYSKYNLFEELKEYEIMGRRLDAMNNLGSVMSADNQTPYFPLEYRVKKFLKLDDDEINNILELREKEKNEAKKAQEEMGGAGGGFY